MYRNLSEYEVIMPYQQPLVPFIVHVADPVDLPIRKRGEAGLCRISETRLVSSGPRGLHISAVGSDGENLAIAIEPAGEGVLRVRLAPSPQTRGRSETFTALARPDDAAAGEVWTDGQTVRLRTGGLVATVRLDPWHLAFHDADGRLLTSQNLDETDISERLRILPFGRSYAEGRIVAYHETFTALPDEHFYGLGEKFTEFDKRGQRCIAWNYDAFSSESERSLKNVPFYLSTRGYGVLVGSGMATEFDFCHSTHAAVQITVPDDLLDYYVLAGPRPADVLRRYHALTGAPVVPPRWAFGTWISTGYAARDDRSDGAIYHQERVVELARAIREHAVPCDVLHIDTQWQRYDHWCDLRWDVERFPDPRGMLKELAGLGFRVSLWLNPYISHLSPVFGEAEAAGVLMRRRDGSTFVADSWHGAQPACGIVDFTTPAGVAWFQDQLRPLLQDGVAVFKTDFGEGVPVDAHTVDGRPGEDVHNVYSLLFNDAVADVTEQVHGHRVVWARSSFTGGQRHAGQWSGDTNATFTAMASTMRGGLSYALSGMPFWSHDVGGFTGRPPTELYVRSAQFGALSPLTRFHGTTSRLPWDFGAGAEAAVIDALRLRYRLMPYLYTAALDAADTGAPVMRPLIVDAPDEPGSWSADLEYLFGPDLLVAPVVNSADASRHVYLPQGSWIDYWSGSVHTGGRHIRVSRPLEQVPLFVRAGALIPTTEPHATVAPETEADLTFVQWGDGASTARVREGSTVTRVETTRAAGNVEIRSTGPVPVNRIAFPAVDGAPPPHEVTVNGRAFTLGPAGDRTLVARDDGGR